MSLKRLKLSIYEVVTPRGEGEGEEEEEEEEEEDVACRRPWFFLQVVFGCS
jgi:hypothetical protein